ncbi:MAG: hypothetical protein A3H97_19830 [Acidobacteria bacterium RIFCSPLOWO2_02_FULL_65_29]|nr:MAG: hypothetical protein A3H97_19830 [Acidobacteria bacterium RIFCSPLOWO2_02_FULL_65_29]
MTPTLRLGAGLLAVAFAALHVPFLPASLEDLDSINFAMGMRDFDVARHQPHPPGYPVFMLAATLLHAVVPSETHVLALLAILAGAAAALALVALFRVLDGPDPPAPMQPLVAALVAVASPLFWITAARPLSDLFGLAAALAAQVMILSARDTRSLVAASACAALAAGVRSQAVWLTVPLLALALGRRVLTSRLALVPGSIRLAAGVGVGYLAGALAWLVPLVMLSGGPAAYGQALVQQGADDFTGVVMLWTMPTLRQLARVLQAAFISPWASAPIAVFVLALAAIGFGRLVRGARPALVTLAAAFGPYLMFDLVFQESATTRYALPLVVPVAYAAAQGASAFRSTVLVAALVALSAFNVFNNTVELSGYSSMKAPAFRLLEDMAFSASSRAPTSLPVLAMHRRHDLDLRRPIAWAGDRMPMFGARLPSPPKHEWLELVKYWNGGGRARVWFVADPPRSDLALVRRQRPPARYRWPFSLPYAMGGIRPSEMDWHAIDPPDWYLGEGWALTPETAGVAREDGRGPSQGGSGGWLRRWPVRTTMVVGFRNLAGPPARARVAVDGRIIDELTIGPGPGRLLRLRMLPTGDLSGAGDYAELMITVEPPGADVAITQFDAQPSSRLLFGYGEGWHEHEYDPERGRLWRWTSERATLRVHAAGRAVKLRLEGEIEEASTSHVTIRAGGRVVSEHDIGETFSIEATVPAELLAGDEASITIETSEWYIPAERWLRRSTDQRHLGLKVFSCVLAPAS